MKANVGGMLPQLVMWTALVAAGALPGEASAQQVEVVAAQAMLRLDPDAASPAIASLPAGTVLEWVGESGPYYAVSLPGPPGEDDIVGYVLASEVAVAGAAGPLAPGASPLGGGMAIPSIQQQHAMAGQAQSTGVTRVAQGAALAASATLTVSLFFEVEDREHYETEEDYEAALEREETANSVKTAAVVGGAALAAYGIGRYVLGWRAKSDLERQFPEATTAPLERQYAEATLSRSLGRRKVFWGAFLAGASFAAVEWVPYFEVPDPEDFDNASEFRSAVNRREDAETARKWITGTGAVLGIWGVAQWVLASQKLGEIEQMSRMSALTAPVDADWPVSLFVGRADSRTQIGVAWSP